MSHTKLPEVRTLRRTTVAEAVGVRPGRREALEERLEDPTVASDEQRDAVRTEGELFLRACPGSGKTRTVGLRLAYRSVEDPEASVAALSHTNIAVKEIRAAAQSLAQLPGNYFVGTLHSFLLRYVVYPFGHTYMQCTEVPQVVADDRAWPTDAGDTCDSRWTQCRIRPWQFHGQVDHSLRYQPPLSWPKDLTEEVIVETFGAWAKREKAKLWKQGLLSFADVLYVAMRVLEDHPELAEAVSARFDEIIVDEVQDTNDLQLRALKLLRAPASAPALVMAGDPDQAVYEWGGARPAELRTFVSDQELPEKSLTRNFRSTQRICDATHRLSTRSEPDHAAGENAKLDHSPEVWLYSKAEEDRLVGRFSDRIEQLGLDKSRSAVLTRTNGFADRLNGRSGQQVKLNWILQVVGQAAANRDRGDTTADDFKALDRVVAFLVYGVTQPTGLVLEERMAIRSTSADLLNDLPTVQGSLRDWNKEARTAAGKYAAQLAEGTPSKNVNQQMTDKAELRHLDSVETFAPAPAVWARTVHGAKGENVSAVLVAARKQEAESWSAGIWTDAPPTDVGEEVRIAYVATTRAESFLVVAFPNSTPGSLLQQWRDIGFVQA